MNTYRKIISLLVGTVAGALAYYLVPEPITAVYIAFIYWYVAYKIAGIVNISKSVLFNKSTIPFALIIGGIGPALNLISIHEPMSHALKIAIIMYACGLMAAGMVTVESEQRA